DEPVHGGVDARGRPARAEEAVVEGSDHLVLALDARVDVDERAYPVEAQYREALLGESAEVAARALDPEQLDGFAGDGVRGRALRGGVAAGVVGVGRVGTQTVAARDELGGGRRGHAPHAPHPAWAPPTRAEAIVAP